MELWRMESVIKQAMDKQSLLQLIGPFMFNIHLDHIQPKSEHKLKQNGGKRRTHRNSRSSVQHLLTSNHGFTATQPLIV
jgi:hypothetical protein